MALPTSAGEGKPPTPDAIGKAQKLVRAYPDQLAGIEGNALVWKDGARMTIDDGNESKDFADLLKAPDIKDQFALPYTPGPSKAAPRENFDPGRFRNEAFFTKMYGDCSTGEAQKNLVEIDWLPRKGGGKLRVTTVNGIDRKLKAVSEELDALPHELTKYLVPSAGAYNCRKIAGMSARSMHSYGAAIDISADESDYWRWAKPDADGHYPYRNRIPFEIVRIFEKHGFIWGGKWYHYDTMHFEYRPELIDARP
ncbi:MAG: M15 family metallopeptidase [Hyphomicrobiales bacterium]|nr:M15 family metallopeptidase [Hyphomicrobiales bacterium]